MTKNPIGFMESAAFDESDGGYMKLDLFDGALWRRKISEPTPEGAVTVTLSTGKKVIVNSRLLGLLRVLADELAKAETKVH